MTNISFCKIAASALNKVSSHSAENEWTVSAAPPSANLQVIESDKFQINISGDIVGQCLLEIARIDLPRLGGEQSPAMSSAASALSEELKTALSAGRREITVEAKKVLEPDFDPTISFHLLANRGTEADIILGVRMTNELFKQFSESETQLPAPTLPIGNLGMVLDVELNVILRFGERQMSLRDVLELKTGAVVELDRKVEEPVELLLDGTVLARGEAVIIDGNYGLRVTEVLQPVASRFIN